MKRIRLLVGFLFLLLAFANTWLQLYGQSGFDDDRVMLQGFYWQSHRHGHPGYTNFGTKHWYEIVRDAAATIRQARFDLVWLPPPSYAGHLSAGYNPKEYFTLSNSYGDFAQHRAMLETLLQQGIEPVADIVISHRDGNTGWTDFKNPAWGLWAITRDDEAFLNPDSGVAGTPVGQRGAPETHPDYVSHAGTTYQYPSFRDIDHTNMQVRRDLLKYLLQLKSAGYRRPTRITRSIGSTPMGLAGRFGSSCPATPRSNRRPSRGYCLFRRTGHPRPLRCLTSGFSDCHPLRGSISDETL